MTKKELEEYRSLKAELAILNDEINDMIFDYKEFVSVTGSDDEAPYISHHIKVWGVPLTNKEFKAKIREYKEKRIVVIRHLVKVETFIDSIEDSDIRSIIFLHWIKDIPYWKIPAKLGRDGDGTTEFKKVSRYLRTFNIFNENP